MSKQYFTKYLPVEGKTNRWKDNKSGEVFYYDGNEDLEGAKRVKLFLCSRDIQVGDKDYYYIDSTENNKVEKAPDYWSIKAIEAEPDGHIAVKFDNSTFLWIEECFKVIGEISPDAIWVTEGMEFDLKDFNPLSAAAIEHSKKLTEPIRIQCPNCKQFH